jgi:4-nitrophenyl phosphatase
VIDFSRIRALALDGDGTLWRGAEALPGLADLAAFARERRLPLAVLTNNSTRSPRHYAGFLTRLGLPIDESRVITSSVATAAYLRRELPAGGRAYVIGEAGLVEQVSLAGFEIAPDARAPVDAVVVGGDSALTYAKLKHACLLLQRGARFIGTNPDVVSPAEEGLLPEAGTNIAALHAATGVAAVVMGKPEPHLFEMAARALEVPPAQIAVVGDRAEIDIAGGERAGMQTMLVGTGVDDAASARQKGIEPSAFFADLRAMIDAWPGGSQF